MATSVQTLLGEEDKDVIKIKERLTSIDKKWLRNSYLTNPKDIEDNARGNLYWSNAHLKFTDTSLGGNFGINCKYGFTPSADVPIAGRLKGREEYNAASESMDFGMGRRYSEMFDDNDQILYLQMGDPKFQSLLSFVTHAVDYGTSVVANTGRSLWAYYAGLVIAGGVAVYAVCVAFPWWGAALFLAGAVTKAFLLNDSDFSYYRLQPAMHKYWRMVNVMTTKFGVELGLLNVEALPKEENEHRIGEPTKLTSQYAKELSDLIPDIYSAGDGYFDVFAVANKTQVLMNKQLTLERKYYNDPNNTKTFTQADKIAKQEAMKFSSYIDELFKLYRNTDWLVDTTSAPKTDNEGKVETTETSGDVPTKSKEDLSKSRANATIDKDGEVTIGKKAKEDNQSWWGSFFTYLDSSARHGSNFATFRVEYTGSTTETFSNSVTEVPLKDTINNLSKKSRSIMFSASGGNIFGDVQESIINAGKDFLMGSLESVTFGLSNVVATLMGGGFYDIPKMWDDSSFEYQRHSFKIRLEGPYGHPIAQMQDIYIPLFMLIAAVAPQQTGKAGYTTPMLCSPFIKGILNSPLAIIDSLSIERGVSNMGYDKKGRPLAVEVSFSITDLTGYPTAPLDPGIFGPLRVALDDYSPMSRYLQLLAGRDLYTSKYLGPRTKKKWEQLRQGVIQITEPSRWGDLVGGWIGGSVLGSLVEGLALPASQRN